jgi:hypothetical protein
MMEVEQARQTILRAADVTAAFATLDVVDEARAGGRAAV